MKGLRSYSLILLLATVTMQAQVPLKEVPELDFAHFDRNRIELRGDSSAFERFYCKLDSVVNKGEGNLRIMHIGGSHVQAGTLTRQLRSDLLSLGDSLDGGRGLVFPFSAAKTNNPSSFRTRYEGDWKAVKNVQREPAKRLGLTGMALSTSDTSAYVKIVLKARNATPDEPEFAFDRVAVLGYPAGDIEPVVQLEAGDTLQGIRDEEVSCWFFDLPEALDSVKLAVRGEGELTLTGIFLDNPSPGISVTGIGVNGAALTSYAKCEDLERDLGLVDPDLVIFAIGINDAAAPGFSGEVFIERYKTLVDRIRSVKPDCALLFVTNNDSFRRIRKKGYVVNRNALSVEKAFFKIAEDCGGGVWNFFDIMGGLESMRKWETAGLAKRDKIHFTEEGYALVGDLLFDALMDKFNEYLGRTSR